MLMKAFAITFGIVLGLGVGALTIVLLSVLAQCVIDWWKEKG
jgi:hypothetical protein